MPRVAVVAPAEPRTPVRLAWVLVDGALRAVAAFAGLPRAARPAATCPVCAESVVLRLGARVVAHAAHRPGSPCPLQHEETALHLNTKHHLAAALRVAIPDARGSEMVAAPTAPLALRLVQRCAHRFGVLGETIWAPGLVPCPARHESVLADGWDEVRVEAGLADLRPDVLLLRRGVPVAALEVRRTHALTAGKIERLAALGVPWGEVVATRALYAEFTAWTADRPLLVLRSHERAVWWCDAHRDAHRDRAARRGDAGPGDDVPWAARVVDRYFPDGRVARDVLCVTGTRRGGRVAEPALRWRHDDAPVAQLAPGAPERVLRAAHAAFRAWARRERARGARVDSPMSWVDAHRLHADAAPGDAATASDAAWAVGDAVFPRRLTFDRARGTWAPRAGVGARPWAVAELLPGAEPRARAPRGRRR